MALIDYDIVQPPTVDELENRLRGLSQLGEAVLDLVVRRIPNELEENSSRVDIPLRFKIQSITRGGTPHIIGSLIDRSEVTGRISVGSHEGPDEARPLNLTLYDPEY